MQIGDSVPWKPWITNSAPVRNAEDDAIGESAVYVLARVYRRGPYGSYISVEDVVPLPDDLAKEIDTVYKEVSSATS